MNGVSPLFDRVKSIILTLEEFKMLDGFVGKFSICNPSIDFEMLVISIKGIDKSVCDGAHVPEVKSKCLKGGEYLFKWVD